MRHRRMNSAFTLVEALISIAIMAVMLLSLAAVFRQTSKFTSQARGGATAFRAARQIFDGIGRDLAGVTRDGFLFIRTQKLDIKAGQRYSGLILYYDEDRSAVRVNGGRFDVMVMTTAGYQISAVDSAKQGNFARVIWAQSERASGNDLPAVRRTPKFWGINQVLCRHQTLMLPDKLSSDATNSSYAGDGGANRGADYFNMGISELTRFFGPAMGAGGEENLTGHIESSGLFSTMYSDGRQELTPFRLASKVWRFGRSGGSNPGGEGSGDLTRGQVNTIVEDGFLAASPAYSPPIAAGHERDDCIRGQERPKIFGPEDYHRIAAFGVARFQVDWSDGRRVPVQDPNDSTKWIGGTRLQFYPEHKLGGYSSLSLELMGPGVKRTWCWNSHSPTSIRNTSLRKSFGGVIYAMPYITGDFRLSSAPSNRLDMDWYSQNMFGGAVSGTGGGDLGDAGWPWPRAIRVRLLIYDTTQDPPIGYEFEQIFHMLVQ